MRLLFFFILFFHFGNKGIALPASPDTVLIGAYISSIHNLDIATSEAHADIHLWCVYSDPKFNFEKELDFIHSSAVELSGNSLLIKENLYWFYSKVKLVARQQFEVIKYPFDSQRLIFTVESSEYSSEDMVFVADTLGSGIDTEIYSTFDEWKFTRCEFLVKDNHYNTSFGDFEVNGSTNSRFTIIIEIERKHPWLLLVKLITGILVAFMIASCVFWIKPSFTDPRFGLCVGGLFAAIGNKYIVESIIPSNNALTMLDLLHNMTFVAIFVIIIISIFSLYYYEKENNTHVQFWRKIDRTAFFSIIILYFSLFFLIVKGFD